MILCISYHQAQFPGFLPVVSALDGMVTDIWHDEASIPWHKGHTSNSSSTRCPKKIGVTPFLTFSQ